MKKRQAAHCKAFPNVCKVRKAMEAARKVALAAHRKRMAAIRKVHMGRVKDARKAAADAR